MVTIDLREMPVPVVCYWTNVYTQIGETLHYTDTRRKTLCGLKGRLVAPLTPSGVQPAVTCTTCAKAATSRARIKRLT